MRVFVAGGTGVVGRLAIPLLVQAGHEVVATTRSARRLGQLAALGATGVVVDVFDASATRDAVRNAAPDVVMHQLTDLSSHDTESNARVRRIGTRHLVDAAIEAGVQRFIAQSIAWVASPGAEHVDESAPFDDDRSEPRRTTIAGVRELETQSARIPEHVVLRYGMLYGPGTWYARHGRFGLAARHGDLPATDAVIPFLHVADAAAAAVAALDWPAGIVDVVDDEPASGHDWLPVFAAAVGGPEPRHVHGGNPGRPVSNARLHDLGFPLAHPTWREGFATL